jgi:hypothetical protein
VRSENYHGFILDEYVGSSDVSFNADLAIFMASWESRAVHLASQEVIKADQAIVLSFSDAQNNYRPSPSQLGLRGIDLKNIDLGSHYKIQEAIEAFLPSLIKQKSFHFGRVFIDITCMPKFLAQYLVLELVKSKVISELILGYTSGRYLHDASDGGVYDQGIQGYLSLPHTANVGISTRKGGIAALGADERLIGDYFTNEAGFDEHFLIAADGAKNASVDEKVQNQTLSLARKFHLSDAHIKSVSPSSFLRCLDAYEDFLEANTEIDSWDVFCCGPKPHAIAACLAALRHDTVKLIGRVPSQYDTTNVEAGETISLLRIIDATSPAISRVKEIQSPFRMK